MSKNSKEEKQSTTKAKQPKNVSVAGDLSVSTDCVKKSVGSSKEVR